MRTIHVTTSATWLCACACACAWLLAARTCAEPRPLPRPIMVWSGKLGPITPPLPSPPPPVPYPPVPPAPVWEDPEPGLHTNSLLTLPAQARPGLKYGFRLKPLKTYLPQAAFSKEFVYPYV